MLFILFLIGLLSFSSCQVPKSKELKCAVCKTLVGEIQAEIDKVDPKKTVEVGSFRIDADGSQKKSLRKYAGSESHMTEVLENVCAEMKDFVQARSKETNKIEIIKLIVDGKMNPNFNDYELIQDPELNKGVEFHCQSIVEDFEDDFMDFFQHNTLNVEKSQRKFCQIVTNICPSAREDL